MTKTWGTHLIITDQCIAVDAKFSRHTLGVNWVKLVSKSDDDAISTNEEFADWLKTINLPKMEVVYQLLPYADMYVYRSRNTGTFSKIPVKFTESEMKTRGYELVEVIKRGSSGSQIVEGILFEFQTPADAIMFRFRWLD